MARRHTMTAFAIALPIALAGCNEPAREPADVKLASAEPAPGNLFARIMVAGLTTQSFMARAGSEQFAQAQALIRQAWNDNCRPGSIREVIGADPERSSWRVECAGGHLSRALSSPDYLLDIPNENTIETLVNKCFQRADGSLRCDTTGRDRS